MHWDCRCIQWRSSQASWSKHTSRSPSRRCIWTAYTWSAWSGYEARNLCFNYKSQRWLADVLICFNVVKILRHYHWQNTTLCLLEYTNTNTNKAMPPGGCDCTNSQKQVQTKCKYKYNNKMMQPRDHLLTGSCYGCAPLKPRNVPPQDVHDHLGVVIWSPGHKMINDQGCDYHGHIFMSTLSSQLFNMLFVHEYRVITVWFISFHIKVWSTVFIITVSAMSSALWPVTILFTPSWNRNI